MATTGTYFINGTTWPGDGTGTSATNIYTDSALTTPAPAGWYKSGSVYREVQGVVGLLEDSASCTTCGTAFVLGYGATAFAACCSGTTATFYLDTSDFATATSVWTSPLMSTKAANQQYSYSGNSRNKVSDTSFTASTGCATCYPAIGLAFGATAAAACCTGTSVTYYMNQTTFAASTKLYTNSDGSTAAGNGYYAYDAGAGGTVVQKQVTGGDGSLATSTTNCASCPTSISLCYSSVSVDELCCTGCASLTSFTGSTASNFNGVCSETIGTTYYHNGSGSLPVVGDLVFTNSGGTTPLSNAYYKINTAATDDSWIRITGSNGYIAALIDC